MAQLFSFRNIGRVGKYVCLVVTSLFIYCTASGIGHYHTGTTSYSYHYDFPAIVPAIVAVPEPNCVNYAYPKNDAKPVNTNYQVIKQRSLGLINAQMNV